MIVLEGRTPVAKAKAMQQRYAATEGGSFGRQATEQEWRAYLAMGPSEQNRFRVFQAEVKELAEAMGVPVVQAKGEAEATCAYLNAQGLVDGVATNDCDCLLYGGRLVYKGLKISTAKPGERDKTFAEVLDMGRLEARLGISRYSLMGLAFLAGSDFDPSGAKAIGPRRALELVRILKGRLEKAGRVSESEQLLAELDQTLRRPVDEELLARPAGCSTCQRCKHGGTKKQQHGLAGCVQCGTHAVAKGGSGEGGCLAFHWPKCPCGPCETQDDRKVNQIAKKAQQTKNFLQRFALARQAFSEAMADAAEGGADSSHQLLLLHESQQAAFSWACRPAEDRLKEILRRIHGPYMNLTKRVLPLFLEWDVRLAGRLLHDLLTRTDKEAASELSRAAEDFHVLFVPRAIVRESRIGTAGGGMTWRYTLEFEAVTEEARRMVRDAAVPRPDKGAKGEGDEEEEGGEEDEEAQPGEEADSGKAGEGGGKGGGEGVPSLVKLLTSEKRSVRKVLVDRLYPWLVDAHREREERKRAAVKAPVKKTRSGLRGLPLAGSGGRTLVDFFGPAKPKRSSSSSSAGSSSRMGDFAEEGVEVVEEQPAVGQHPQAAAGGAQVDGAPMCTPTKSDARSRIHEPIDTPQRPRKLRRTRVLSAEEEAELREARRDLGHVFQGVEQQAAATPTRTAPTVASSSSAAAASVGPPRAPQGRIVDLTDDEAAYCSPLPTAKPWAGDSTSDSTEEGVIDLCTPPSPPPPPSYTATPLDEEGGSLGSDVIDLTTPSRQRARATHRPPPPS